MAELIAKRYGQALFELAYESGDLTKREQEIRQMLDALTHDDDFFVLLNHPKLSKAEKIAVLEKIFAGKVSDELVGFLVLAVEKGRQDCIVDILNYTLKKIEEHNGYVTAHVTTAIELSETAMTDIRTKLEKQTGKKISLVSHVDKSVIGGLFVRINDRVVDNTLKGAIHRMSRNVYEAKV